MNGGQCNTGAIVLSDKDKLALASLYPVPTCYYSHWSLVGGSNGYIPNNTTLQYQIIEDGPQLQVLANSPTIRVSTYGSGAINVLYNGTVYYCPAQSGVNIPINGSIGCAGTNPTISASLIFQKTVSGNSTVMVALNTVSPGHTFANGYQSFTIY